MDISFAVFFGVCVCVFVWLRISPPRIKLAASYFAKRFIGVQGRESHVLVTFAPAEAKNRTNRPARGPRPPECKRYDRDAPTRHAKDAPFVKSRGVRTDDRHVWIYGRPRRRTYLLLFQAVA